MAKTRPKAAATPDLTGTDRVYLVVGIRCWGKGKTVHAAKRRAAKEGSVARYKVFETHEDSFVTPLGDVSYPLEHGPPREVGGNA